MNESPPVVQAATFAPAVSTPAGALSCPSKRSDINPSKPPRLCVETCGRYEYAAHLTGRDWIKPAVRFGKCENWMARAA
jgi:hypothetical protein